MGLGRGADRGSLHSHWSSLDNRPEGIWAPLNVCISVIYCASLSALLFLQLAFPKQKTGQGFRTDGREKSFIVDNHIKQHHICCLISTKRFTGLLPLITIRRLLRSRPAWFTHGDLARVRVRSGHKASAGGRSEAGDFIILCVCLEVIRAFWVLTSLRPNTVTLGMNEVLAVSSSAARSSKSRFRAPALPAPLPHSPAIRERQGAWETPPHRHLCPSSRTYFRGRVPTGYKACF